MDIKVLMSILKAALGDIRKIEETCPGVFHIKATGKKAGLPCPGEYYVVRRNTSVISEKAKAYGRKLSSAPDFLIYPWNEDTSGWRIVKYEVNRYLYQKGNLPNAETELRDSIAFGREFHPDYFGCYPLPAVTPWGVAVCYVELDTGIFWIVTRQKREVLCVCYPIWDELSEYSRKIAVTEDALKTDHMPDHLLFSRKNACVPFYELLPPRRQWLESGLIALPQLMNAICAHHAKYVLNHNLTAQMEHALMRQLLMHLTGADILPQLDETHLIIFSPEAGTDYLHIEKAVI